MQGPLGSYQVGLGRPALGRCPRWRRRGSRTPRMTLIGRHRESTLDPPRQLNHGAATACVAPQHAGCTGRLKLRQPPCSPPTSRSGHGLADFDVYIPDRVWVADLPRGRGRGLPDDLECATKPCKLAMRQLGPADRGRAAGQMSAFDEVYGRSREASQKAANAGWPYVAIMPVRLPGHLRPAQRRSAADHPLGRRCSKGVLRNGSKGPPLHLTGRLPPPHRRPSLLIGG